jgi:hypothetical protein
VSEPIEVRFERFFERADADICWEWRGCKNPGGYGKIAYAGGPVLAHRVAFMLEHGRWPEPGCLHSCDNPACVNPAHLFEGTPADNAADRGAKGRTRAGKVRGSRHGSAKLTERDIPVIRALVLWSGFTKAEVGREFGVGEQNIGRIVRREIWRHA